MAHSNNSIITGKLTGSIGKELVFREWKGKTIVAKAPKKRKGEPTPAQAETQERFFMATRYAKAIAANADPDLAAAYTAALRPRQNLYSRALEDFMSSPVVKQVDTRNYNGTAGSTIQVRAIDDFRGPLYVWRSMTPAAPCMNRVKRYKTSTGSTGPIPSGWDSASPPACGSKRSPPMCRVMKVRSKPSSDQQQLCRTRHGCFL